MKSNNRIKFMAKTAIIAALYTALTFLCSLVGLSSGVIQLRLSEALIVLTAFTPAAIPGLTIGCLLSNFLTAAPLWDVIFGPLATLIGALGGYFLRRFPYAVPVPNIVSNTVIVPLILRYAYGVPDALPFLFTTVFIGEFLSTGVFGLFLYSIVRKHNRYLN